MRTLSQNARALRAEAQIVGAVGLVLLALGLALTLILTSLALSPDGLAPLVPALIGGPPIVFGYLACRHASSRLARARAYDRPRR